MKRVRPDLNMSKFDTSAVAAKVVGIHPRGQRPCVYGSPQPANSPYLISTYSEERITALIDVSLPKTAGKVAISGLPAR